MSTEVKMFLRRSEAMLLLGLTERQFDKLRAEKILKPAPLLSTKLEVFSRLHLLSVKQQIEGVTK